MEHLIDERILAVREDRMRGGRNKFGTYYKQDRAQRMKLATRSNVNTINSNNQNLPLSYVTYPHSVVISDHG